jgi:hypothetical protein
VTVASTRTRSTPSRITSGEGAGGCGGLGVCAGAYTIARQAAAARCARVTGSPAGSTSRRDDSPDARVPRSGRATERPVMKRGRGADAPRPQTRGPKTARRRTARRAESSAAPARASGCA